MDDSGWISLNNHVKYRKKAGIVTINFYSIDTTYDINYKVVGTLPAGYRPSITIYTTAGFNTGDVGVAYVDGNGNIGLKTFSGTTMFAWFFFCYPV